MLMLFAIFARGKRLKTITGCVGIPATAVAAPWGGTYNGNGVPFFIKHKGKAQWPVPIQISNRMPSLR